MSHSIFSKIKAFCILISVNLKVTLRNFFEYIRVVFKYYSNFTFLKIDLSLLLYYLFNNPFRISKHFLTLKGEQNVYTYGETPLTTLDKISKFCNLSSQDTVFELGCGRGRTCFWLSQFIGCQVVGIEFVPFFIEKAQKIKTWFDVKNVTFRLEDLFKANLNNATVIYLYGTCFSAEEIEELIQQFSKLPDGTKIITVSYALTEYDPEAPFHILNTFPATFTWGIADVYLQIKTDKKVIRPSRPASGRDALTTFLARQND